MRVLLVILSLVLSAPAWGIGTGISVGKKCPSGTGVCAQTHSALFYVATTGSDASCTANGTASAPWLTVGKARDCIRTRGLAGTRSITVNIAAGTYLITSAVVFGATDSGASGREITYRCAGSVDSCIFDGGAPVTGWSVHAGSVSKATIAAPFYTLWENGRRARAARAPNRVASQFYPTAFAPYYTSTGVDGSYTSFKHNPANFVPDAWNMTDIRLFTWGTFSGGANAWFTDTASVSAYDTGTDTFTVAHSGTKFTAFSVATGARFTVGSVLDVLDEAGEFYVDTVGLLVYYWPLDGAIGSQIITAPKVSRVFSFVGTDATTRTKYITLNGLTVKNSDFPDWYRRGYCCTNGSGEGHTYSEYDYWVTLSANRQGLIYLQDTDHITLAGMHLKNAGLDGVHMRGYGQSNTVRDSWIEHVGHDGILLDGNYPGEGDTLKSNTISNVIVHNFGELAGDGMGFVINQSGSNTISHVEAYLGPRDCMQVAGNAQLSSPAAVMYSHDNTLSNFRFHDCLEDSGDSGVFRFSFLSNTATPPYATNYLSQGTINGGYADPTMTDADPVGVFCDNETNGQDFANVQVSNVKGAHQRDNSSGNHTTSNVSWVGGFSESGMDYANHGITTANPFYTLSKYTFADGFEGTLANWTTALGTPTISTTQAHAGTHSFVQNEDGEVIYTVFDHRMNQIATVWFYDDSADTTLEAFARAEESQYVAGVFKTWDSTGSTGPRALGVYTPTSTTNYVYWVGGVGIVATSITRTTGWHELKFDYSGGARVDMSIDGTLVASPLVVRALNNISMGDFDPADSNTGTVYWDDVAVN